MTINNVSLKELLDSTTTKRSLTKLLDVAVSEYVFGKEATVYIAGKEATVYVADKEATVYVDGRSNSVACMLMVKKQQCMLLIKKQQCMLLVKKQQVYVAGNGVNFNRNCINPEETKNVLLFIRFELTII